MLTDTRQQGQNELTFMTDIILAIVVVLATVIIGFLANFLRGISMYVSNVNKNNHSNNTTKFDRFKISVQLIADSIDGFKNNRPVFIHSSMDMKLVCVVFTSLSLALHTVVSYFPPAFC